MNHPALLECLGGSTFIPYQSLVILTRRLSSHLTDHRSQANLQVSMVGNTRAAKLATATQLGCSLHVMRL